MRLPSALALLLLALGAHAATNEPCYGSGGRAGVCISTSACTKAGGSYISGACKSDPANIKCCTKARCGSNGGNCRWTSDCAGKTVANKCPGPDQMKCCSSSARGWGGYGNPTLPKVGVCKAKAVNGAKKIVAKFPGRIRQIQCYRKCACGSGPELCCGMANTLMIADATGRATISGREMAEWIMNNRNTLSLKYVIWGQRIWVNGRDKVQSWTGWRTMENRASITGNHWDHLSVAYK